MSTLHSQSNVGSVPSFDHGMIAADCMVEIDDLFNLLQNSTFTNKGLREEGMVFIRGMVCRLRSVAEVMYAAASADDCRLQDVLPKIFGSSSIYLAAPQGDPPNDGATPS